MGLRLQIGEVSTRTGLSVRTIRYYEEVGLVEPSARTSGGFRLYTDVDIARLQMIRRMKPLGFSLEEMRDLLTALDTVDNDGSSREDQRAAVERLTMFHEVAAQQCARLREQLETAEGFAEDLRREIRRRDTETTRR